MHKPIEFQQAQVTLRKLPYILHNSSFPDGGVLACGQVVWTRAAGNERGSTTTIGYVEGVGVLSLNSRVLVRADLPNPEQPVATSLEIHPISRRT